MDGFHCQEYEYLTMEERLLVDIEMRKWYARANLPDFCAPTFIFRELERRIIEEFKRKERNDKRNRKPSAG